MLKPLASWNSNLQVWITEQESLFSEHLELFQAVFPKSGMTAAGRLFELQTQGRLTSESVSLSSPTLPTPKARDFISEGYESGLRRNSPQVGTIVKGLVNGDDRVLLPTTRVSMAKGATPKEVAAGNPKSRIEAEVLLGETNWGKFTAAIERWEQVIGRKAPAPTKPDGKDGSHRLSSLFTEWLMGLPEGHITGHNLSRADELKMAGNGVVPQQAEIALRFLIDDNNFK